MTDPLIIQVGSGIELRSLHASEAFEVFNVIRESREYLKEWLPWVESTKTVQDVEDFIAKQQTPFIAKQQTQIIEKSEEKLKEKKRLELGIWQHGKFVGGIALGRIDDVNKKANVTYWLAKKYQGQGIMTISMRALVRYAFEKMNLNRLEIRTAVNNIRGANIPIKLGFKLDGILREGMQIHDEYVDLSVFSLLREDFH